ncbi:MAG TPA: flagellar hook capping FlgD N-terminal domain-containing protein [Alphaproteobacteria bacterium]|nr:flagellar hook capping FlgD N-terminal domain-containing protein [Alphaproteobacteria bacterium]
MTSSIAPTSNSSLLSSYITQSQQGTTAAEQQMANNVSNGTNASSSAAGLSGNFDTFLKILTTQLKNQDPSSPLDTNQFTQELVQFSGVEQQINTNDLLKQLVGSNGVKSLLNYVGNYVETPSTNNQILVQGGQSNFSYTLPSAAQKVALTVKDASGNTVTTLNGTTNNGVNNVTWNGKDSSGNAVADGLYTLSVAATDSGGNAITPSSVDLIGQVTGVQTADSSGNDLLLGPYLSINDANVNTILSPAAMTANTPSAPSS